MSAWSLLVVSVDSDRGAEAWEHSEANGRILVVGPSFVTEAVQRLRQLSDVTHVTVVSRSEDRPVADLVASMVSGDRPELAVSRILTAGPVLAAASLGAELVRRATPPTTAHNVLVGLLPTIPSGVWLKRVSKLNRPSPSMRQHIASWFSSHGFLVVSAPTTTVLSARDRLPNFGSLREATLVVDAGVPANVASDLRAQLGCARVTTVPRVQSPSAAYGSDGGEFAVIPEQLVGGQPLGTQCPSCGEPLFTAACPFCHVSRVAKTIDEGEVA